MDTSQLQEVRPGAVPLSPNKSLQRTFDPPPIFAVAKTGAASNAAELRRYGARVIDARHVTHYT